MDRFGKGAELCSSENMESEDNRKRPDYLSRHSSQPAIEDKGRQTKTLPRNEYSNWHEVNYHHYEMVRQK